MPHPHPQPRIYFFSNLSLRFIIRKKINKFIFFANIYFFFMIFSITGLWIIYSDDFFRVFILTLIIFVFNMFILKNMIFLFPILERVDFMYTYNLEWLKIYLSGFIFPILFFILVFFLNVVFGIFYASPLEIIFQHIISLNGILFSLYLRFFVGLFSYYVYLWRAMQLSNQKLNKFSSLRSFLIFSQIGVVEAVVMELLV